jgi:deoxycytidylate deaminase
VRESYIITAINHYLELLENQGRLVFFRNNSGALINQHGRFIRFGKAGAPDFMVYLLDGRCVHLEVKNEKGKQSPNQLEYQAKIEKLGHRYCIVRSVDEVEILIKQNKYGGK